MYTLRTFKAVNEINRHQFNLGDYYKVVSPSEGDEKEGIILRVHGAAGKSNDDGFAIHEDHYAFIMTESGKTFETLNRPRIKADDRIKPDHSQEILPGRSQEVE